MERASPTPPAGTPGATPWAAWLAWTWVALVVAAALSELLGWTDLRLALDFARHLRGA